MTDTQREQTAIDQEFAELEKLMDQEMPGASEENGGVTNGSSNSDDSRWTRVVEVLTSHFYEPDIQAARAIYAAVAAHDLNGQPVWPIAVAPPGSMKSELLLALDGLPRVHLIDSVTPKTFISGQIIEEPGLRPASLLHRIGRDGIIVCSEFSTVLAMKAEERNAVLADLRKIFDGKLTKEFGTTEQVPAWEGRISLIAAVTPKIDDYYSVIQSLGDRFVMIRWHRAGMEAARRAIRQNSRAMREDLRVAVHNLLTKFRTPDIGL